MRRGCRAPSRRRGRAARARIRRRERPGPCHGKRHPQEVVVLDYGGQYSQLIARRIRDCGVFSELLPHHVPIEEVAARKPRGIILSGGPGIGVCRRGAPASTRGCWSWRPGDGHLLRHAAARPHAGRAGRAGRGGRVRPLRAAGRRPGVLLGGLPARADLLDVPSRHGLRAAPGVHRAGLLDRLAGRGRRGSRRGDLRHPVPPRGRPHPLRPGDPDPLPDRASAAASRTGRRPRSSRNRSGGSASRWGRARSSAASPEGSTPRSPRCSSTAPSGTS